MKLIPTEKLREICSEIEGLYGLYISLPDEGEVFQLNSGAVFNSASTIKIPIMALMLKDCEEGRLSLNKTEALAEENRVIGSGILKVMSHGVALSLYDYAVLMLVISDNSATNHIIDAVGVDRFNAFCKEMGWLDTHLAGKLFCPKPILPDGKEDWNRTSAKDLGKMMELLLEEKLVSPEASRMMKQIMAAQQAGKFDKSLPVQKHSDPTLPLPPVSEGFVQVINKGGTLKDKVLHDAAILLLPNGRRAVITLMTATKNNEKTMEIFKRASKALYDHLI